MGINYIACPVWLEWIIQNMLLKKQRILVLHMEQFDSKNRLLSGGTYEFHEEENRVD